MTAFFNNIGLKNTSVLKNPSMFLRPPITSMPNSYINATGGQIYRDGDYLIHFLKDTDIFEILSISTKPIYNQLMVRVIGGGGGGALSDYNGNCESGGGGAGEWVVATLTAQQKIYSITYGEFGKGGGFGIGSVITVGKSGESGGDTIFEGIIAKGGGYGAFNDIGGNGASGGGGSRTHLGGIGTNGFNGGSSIGNINSAAGGGGFLGEGGNSSNEQFPSTRGLGIIDNITGTSTTYCQGGEGNNTNGVDIDGPDGLGWGGSGYSSRVFPYRGGNGSGGGVIIRYFCPVDYYYRLTTLTKHASTAPPMDSTLYQALNETELGLFFGWNPSVFTPDTATNKWWLSSDGGVSFVEQTAFPFPLGTTAHVCSGKRADGLIWFWGRVQPSFKYFVCTLDPTTKAWNVIDDDVQGLGNFAQWGFMHKDYMYTVSEVGGVFKVYKSFDGLMWNFVSDLPEINYYDASAWSDGNIIRVAGGGVQYGATIENVYESSDNGITWSVVSILPNYMKSVWPTYREFDGKEFYLTGFNNPGAGLDGVMYYRDKGSTDDWINANFHQLNGRHATPMTIFQDKLFLGFGYIVNDSYCISKLRTE